MALGEVMYESGGKLDWVYFSTDTIVSLLYVMGDGASAEIAVVGGQHDRELKPRDQRTIVTRVPALMRLSGSTWLITAICSTGTTVGYLPGRTLPAAYPNC